MVILIHDAELADTDTFIAEFTRTLAHVKTYEEAFDIVHDRYKAYYKGRIKFSSYEAFKAKFYRQINKNRGK